MLAISVTCLSPASNIDKVVTSHSIPVSLSLYFSGMSGQIGFSDLVIAVRSTGLSFYHSPISCGIPDTTYSNIFNESKLK